MQIDYKILLILIIIGMCIIYITKSPPPIIIKYPNN